MRAFTCERCGQRLFFENVACGGCGAVIGFVPAELSFASFDPEWQRTRVDARAQKPCLNYASEQVCNWMLPADDSSSPYCLSCRCTEVIPALSTIENRASWSSIEQAKRRLFYSLLVLQLPAPPKTEDPQHGLAFRFLEETRAEPKVFTGHDEGVITLNIAEADDAARERLRAEMHEPYRTLLGHFRHEIGHYYWDRLVQDTAALEEFRRLFGDERADYAQALQQHYREPRLDWPLNFVSVYASSHPWEDWAECWAHYLHILDGLETAQAWGLRLDHAVANAGPVEAQALAGNGDFAADLIQRWLPISQFINAMDRSLGSHDSYPFVLPAPVVDKLLFIHQLIAAAARGEAAMRFSAPGLAPAPVTFIEQS